MINFKKQMEEIFDILSKQKEDLQTKEKHKLEQTQKQASKEKEFKTLSFNSVISRPPFIFAPQKKEYFDPSLPKTFMDTGKALDFSEREALIFPDRVKIKNMKNIYTPCITRADIPRIVSGKNLSQKEMLFREKWEEHYKKLRDEELFTMRQKDDGVLKSQIMKEHLKNSRHFKPNNFAGNFFEQNPSLISENPLTHSVLERLISLERNYEKKYWKPNKKALDTFEKPKQTFNYSQHSRVVR